MNFVPRPLVAGLKVVAFIAFIMLVVAAERLPLWFVAVAAFCLMAFIAEA